MSYGSKPLRAIDRKELPAYNKHVQETDADPCGTPGCGHTRASHYHGKTDNHGMGWHACLCIMCSCGGYTKKETK